MGKSKRGVSRAGVSACDQRERADAGALATPHRPRARHRACGRAYEQSECASKSERSERQSDVEAKAEVERKRACEQE